MRELIAAWKKYVMKKQVKGHKKMIYGYITDSTHMRGRKETYSFLLAIVALGDP